MSDKLEPGKYLCRITGQELRQSKKGNWMAVLRIEPMLFEPRGGTETTAVEFGGTRTYFGTLTPKSAAIVQRELEAVGFKGTKPSEVHIAEGKANMLGNENWWLLSYQESQDGGTPFEKWRPFAPRESAAPAPLSESDLMSVDAMFADEFAGKGNAAKSDGEWNEL